MIKEKLKEFTEKIKLLDHQKKSKNDSSGKVLKGSFAEHDIIDLSDKFVNTSPVVVRQLMPENLEEKIEIMIDQKWYGFESNYTYINFYKFINHLILQNNLDQIFSLEYLRFKILIWLINNKLEGIRDFDIEGEIQRLINEDVKIRLFHYPVSNLDIDQEFNVGPHKITFFKREYFDQYFKKLYGENPDEEQKKHFDRDIRKYQGGVFITIKVRAEPKIAEKIAYREACTVIDIFKLFTPTLYFPPEQCNIDLESRIPRSSDHLMSEPNEIGFTISTSRIGRHLHFTSRMLNDFSPIIQVLSGVFKNGEMNQLRELIRDSISLFSTALNNEDLHRRVALLISICESIFLFDSDNYKMEKKCKRRMAYFLQPDDMEESQKIYELLSTFYEIRHKIQHKSKKLYIDLIQMRDFQILIVEVFRLMMYESIKYNLKENWLKHLDEKSGA